MGEGTLDDHDFTDEARAIAWLEDALETFDRLGMPFESARSRIHIAALLSARDADTEVALSEAQAEKAAFQQSARALRR